MNVAFPWLAASFVAVVLAGCGGGQEQAEEPMPVEESMFGDMVGTMDKARSVEQTTLDHKEHLDRAMDAAEGQQ
jgi:hypothetical protein